MLGNILVNLGVTIYFAVKPIIVRLIQFFKRLIRKLTKAPIQKYPDIAVVNILPDLNQLQNLKINTLPSGKKLIRKKNKRVLSIIEEEKLEESKDEEYTPY